MKQSVIKTVFFYIVVILNIGFLSTLLWDFIILNDRVYQSIFLVLIDILYLFFCGIKLDLRISDSRSPFKYSLWLYFLLLLINLIISLYNHSSSFVLIITLIIVSFLFNNILRSRIKEDIVKPYLLFSNYIIISAILVFLLLSIGLVSLSSWQISSDEYDFFYGNLQISGGSVFSPLYLTFIIDSMRGIPFFGDFGVFTGLSHEPHIITLLVTPALFLGFYRKLKVRYLIFLYILFFLMAGSVTNLILVVFCLLLLLEVSFRNKASHSFIAILSCVLLLIVLSSYTFLATSFGFDIILTKLDSSNMSNEVSTRILEYMYSPKSIIGSDIFIYAYNEEARDIGLINFLLIVLSQLFFVYGAIKMFLSKNKGIAFVAIGLFYFFLHSLKIGQMIYQFPFYVYVLVVADVFFNTNKSSAKIEY